MEVRRMDEQLQAAGVREVEAQDRETQNLATWERRERALMQQVKEVQMSHFKQQVEKEEAVKEMRQTAEERETSVAMVEATQQQARHLEMSLSAVEAEAARYKDSLESLEHNNYALERDVDKLQRDLEESRRQVEGAEKRANEAMRIGVSLEERALSAEDGIHNAEKVTLGHEWELSQLRDENVNLVQRVNVLNAQCEVYQRDLTALQHEKETAQRDAKDQDERMSRQANEQNERMSRQEEDLREKLETTEARLREVEGSFDREVTMLTTTNENLDRDLVEMTRQYEEAVAETVAADEDRTQLRDRLQRVEASETAARTSISELNRDLRDMEEKALKFGTEVEAGKTQRLANEKSKARKLMAMCGIRMQTGSQVWAFQQWNLAIRAVRRQNNRDSSELERALREEVAGLSQELAETTASLTGTLAETKERLEAKNRELESELAASMQELASQELAARQAAAEAAARHETTSEALRNAEAGINDVEKRLGQETERREQEKSDLKQALQNKRKQKLMQRLASNLQGSFRASFKALHAFKVESKATKHANQLGAALEGSQQHAASLQVQNESLQARLEATIKERDESMMQASLVMGELSSVREALAQPLPLLQPDPPEMSSTGSPANYLMATPTMHQQHQQVTVSPSTPVHSSPSPHMAVFSPASSLVAGTPLLEGDPPPENSGEENPSAQGPAPPHLLIRQMAQEGHAQAAMLGALSGERAELSNHIQTLQQRVIDLMGRLGLANKQVLSLGKERDAISLNATNLRAHLEETQIARAEEAQAHLERLRYVELERENLRKELKHFKKTAGEKLMKAVGRKLLMSTEAATFKGLQAEAIQRRTERAKGVSHQEHESEIRQFIVSQESQEAFIVQELTKNRETIDQLDQQVAHKKRELSELEVKYSQERALWKRRVDDLEFDLGEKGKRYAELRIDAGKKMLRQRLTEIRVQGQKGNLSLSLSALRVFNAQCKKTKLEHYKESEKKSAVRTLERDSAEQMLKLQDEAELGEERLKQQIHSLDKVKEELQYRCEQLADDVRDRTRELRKSQQDRQDDRIMYDQEFARLRREVDIAEGIAVQARNSLEAMLPDTMQQSQNMVPRHVLADSIEAKDDARRARMLASRHRAPSLPAASIHNVPLPIPIPQNRPRRRHATANDMDNQIATPELDNAHNLLASLDEDEDPEVADAAARFLNRMDEDDVEGSERSAQHGREKKLHADHRREKKAKEYEAQMEAKARREATKGNRPNVEMRQDKAANDAEREMEDMVKESLRKKRGTPPQSSPRRKDPKAMSKQNELLEMERLVVAQNAEKKARLARSDKQRGALG